MVGSAKSENPYEAPATGIQRPGVDLPEELELYPICVNTGSLDDLRYVNQKLVWEPAVLILLRTCSGTAVGLFSCYSLLGLVKGASGKAVSWLLMTTVGAGIVWLTAFLLSLWLRRVLPIKFSVTESVWMTEQKRRRQWLTGGLVLGVVILILASFSNDIGSARLRVAPTGITTLLFFAFGACLLEAFRSFPGPRLVRSNGHVMIRLSKPYCDMKAHVDEIAAKLDDDDSSE